MVKMIGDFSSTLVVGTVSNKMDTVLGTNEGISYKENIQQDYVPSSNKLKKL
ncbi:hypothetical protein ACI2OX_05245 [Bacillus sp. N9]